MLYTRFDFRRMVAIFSLLIVLAPIALGGEPFIDLNGGPCDGGEEESQAGSTGDGGKDNSDPIYLATGDFQHKQTDLVIPGRGLDFEIKRFYRSRSGRFSAFTTRAHPFNWGGTEGMQPRLESPLGMNWDYNYNMRLDLKGYVHSPSASPPPGGSPNDLDQVLPTSFWVYTGTGRSDPFELISTHEPTSANPVTYANDEHAWALLYTFKEDSIYIIDSNQTTYEFYPFFGIGSTQNSDKLPYAGRLASISDRNGNQITFHYETVTHGSGIGTVVIERIEYAIDTLGHQIDFYYQDDPAAQLSSFDQRYTAQLLWRIVDHAGRIVEYEYDDTDSTDFTSQRTIKLTKATLPSITSTTEFPLAYSAAGASIDHGRFPNGRVW